MALAAVISIIAATPTVLYLTPNSNWTQANARFAAYFFGNGEQWSSMTDSDGDGIYEVAVPSGYPKVIFCRMNPSASTNNWNNKWNQTGDLTIPTDGNNHFTVKSGTWDGATDTWSTYTPPVYTIVGSSAVLGSEWSTDDANNDMSKQDDGTYKLVKENVVLVKDTEYQYKVVRDRSWDWSYPSGNKTFTVDKSGIYNVTFTFDGKTSLEVETVLIKEEIIIPTVALAGTMNDWSTTANVLVLAADSLTASTTIALQANTTDSIKVVLDGNWLGNNGTMTRENDGQAWTFKADENNCVLKTDVAGDYIFTWNFEKSQLTVTYPEKPDTPTPADAVICLAGSMNGWNTALSTFVKADDGLTASVRFYMEAETYSFKVVVDNKWLGSQETITREHCTNWTLEQGDGSDKYNCHIVADQAGDYEFVWTYATSKLSVKYPAKGEVYEPEPAPNGYRTIYLNTKNLWHSDNAKFFAHSWGANDSFQDLQLDFYIGYIYKVYVPNDHSNIVFVRMSSKATEFAWDSEYLWNQTVDLTIPANKDCYTIRGWGTDQGVWTTYGVDHNQDPLYSSSVPSACPDVMLQGFYWDSNQDKYYGCTRWWNLQQEAEEISSYFDLIWLPPSALSSGGVGYHPKQYSNQNSDWGQRGELEYLIKQLHDGGTKVIADMVVNHIEGKDGWCSFYEQDFGEYGYFQVDGSYISQDDEMKWDADEYCRGKATGAWEDGYDGESNYGSARDLAHGEEKVRQLCRAYAKWMVNVMKYDGFRYDYCKGFHMSHVDDYNANAGAYFSVIEYYDGNRDVLCDRIKDANENTLAFDFGMKFNVLNDGIAQFDYAKCKSPNCLIGMGKGKWAVNFIDNHDTFERGNGCDFGGDAMSDAMRDRLLQANAFILSMPGVPCLFYPHWKKYSAELKPMILARKAVGVHSESAVSDEIIGNGYRAVVTGTKGSLILELGDACSSQPWGYSEVAAGPGYKMYITYECAIPELTITPASTTFRTPTLSVNMSATGLAGVPTIYYTLDGSDPKSSATKKTYNGAIAISGNVTLKAYADVAGRQSDVQTCEYTYIPPQEKPIIIAFRKPNNWSKVYLYSWDRNEKYLTGTWPGTQLIQINANGLYYHQFGEEQSREINFILNDGNGTQSANMLTYEDVCYGWENNAAKLINCAENASSIIYHYGTESQGDGVYEIEDEYVGSITYKRIFTPGKWETIYLPFEVEKVTVEDDGEYKLSPWTLASGGNYYLAKPIDDVQNSELYFDFTTELDANKPYIIQFPELDGYYDNRVVTFHGTRKWNELSTSLNPLKPTTQMEMHGNNTLLRHVLQENVYVLRATSDFVLQRSATTLQPFECYVVPQQSTGASPAPKMRVRLRGQDDDIATSFDELRQPALDTTQPMFNILGQQVDANYHGIVIQNGYKYIR